MTNLINRYDLLSLIKMTLFLHNGSRIRKGEDSMIKALIRFSMKNMVALLLMILLIVGGGIYSLKQINIEKYPNVDIPYMTVVIPYPGASPDQSIKDVGEPVEKEMMNLEGVKKVYTEATANAAYVTMEFDMSIDMQEEEGVVRSAIEKVNLPEEVEDPEIILQGPDGDPTVYSIGIYVKDGVGGGDHFITNRMVPALESLNSVSEVKVDGLENKQVFVRLLPDELEKMD